MKLLLDTHVFLWWWDDDQRLAKVVRKAIEGADGVFVSAASTWDLAIKQSLGRLRFEGRFVDALSECEFDELPVRSAHADDVPVLWA